MTTFFRRLHYLLNRRRFERELDGDMEFHREMAARAGRTNFGSTLRLREESRDAWGWTWIDRLFQDLRFAARTLHKSPGFTLAAIVMLGIGIGVNVAAFGFFNLIVWKPLPVSDPDTLLRFKRRSPQNYAYTLPYPEVAFFREHSRSLSAVLVLDSRKLAAEDGRRINAHFVSVNFFKELGAKARLGRMLDPVEDEVSGAEPVVVLAHGFWEANFDAAPSVVGKVIRLNGKPATVVGVAHEEFSGLSLDKTDLWLPLTKHHYFVEGSRVLTDISPDAAGVRMWGRLRPGFTPHVAEQELRSLAAELRKQHPDSIWEQESLPSEPGGYATSLMMGTGRGTGTEPGNPLYFVAALVSTLVLLILAVACGNLGSLLLARGVAREREIATRIAVGAGRRRLIRQLFTENVLLALLGSLAGLLFGYVVLQSLLRFTGGPPWLTAKPDWPVVLFAIGLGFIAAIIFGLMPAIQIARQRQRATVMRQVLVGTQVAASCVLLIIAGLLTRALNHATSMHPGFDYEHVIGLDPGLSTHGYSPENARAYLNDLQGRLRALPGVVAVSTTATPPVSGRNVVAGMVVDGRAVDIHIKQVDPDFFQTMNIPILRGRKLIAGDTNAIVVSESLVRRHWPSEDPIGKQFLSGVDATGVQTNYTVVGVSASARLNALKDPDAVELYQITPPADLPSSVVLVKTSGPPDGFARLVASVAKSTNPNLFPEVWLLEESFRRKIGDTGKSAMVVGVFGSVAHVLACLGILGVVAYAVSQRTKEIGLRMALGARPTHVLLLVFRQLSIPVLSGLLMGLAGAAGLSRMLRRELYGISNLDPATYLTVVGIFAVTVALAALWPARRALRVDPIDALRHE